MRYVDAVERVGDTYVVADYALLSEVEPDVAGDFGASQGDDDG